MLIHLTLPQALELVRILRIAVNQPRDTSSSCQPVRIVRSLNWLVVALRRWRISYTAMPLNIDVSPFARLVAG